MSVSATTSLSKNLISLAMLPLQVLSHWVVCSKLAHLLLLLLTIELDTLQLLTHSMLPMISLSQEDLKLTVRSLSTVTLYQVVHPVPSVGSREIMVLLLP